MITYGHEKFIKEAIEGVLFQEINLPFELLIMDDNSPDNTRIIVEEIIKQSPNASKIRYVHNEINIGMMPNFLKALKMCKGNYIAICEGDDYWTDRYKLSKQFNILESRTDLIGCFHNTEERFQDDENKRSYLYCNFNSSVEISFEDLVKKNLIPTCSIMFRNGILKVEQDFFENLKLGDWPINLFLAQFGNFYFIPQVMAVHRISSVSTWAGKDNFLNNILVLNAYDSLLKFYKSTPQYYKLLKKARLEFKIKFIVIKELKKIKNLFKIN
jgi:glycosyltransferase involved in cell wall biosynthesis